jgi:hypothetical protein
MIYLFGTGAWESSRKVLKIGYTSKKDERESAYLLHNPLGKFLAWRDGDRELEMKLHLSLIDYKEDFLDEWFYDEDPVIEHFSWDIERLDKWLWEERYRVFFDPFIPQPGTLKRKIFDDLQKKYSKNSEILGVKALSEKGDIL